MRYFKDQAGSVYGVDVGQEDIIQSGWVEISEQEATAPPAITEQQRVTMRIYELRQLLQESDYKVLPDYDKPNESVKAQRQAWRDELRKLGG